MPQVQQMSNNNEANEISALLSDLPIDGTDDVIYEGAEEDESIAALESLLEPSTDDEPAAPQIDAGAVADDDTLRDLEFALERHEAYAVQTAVKSADPSAVAEKKAAGPTKSRSSSSGAPSVPRDLRAVPDEFFVLEGDLAAIDLPATRAATEALRPVQKKIAEKFDNLFTTISVGRLPSRYVVLAFELLNERGSFTSSDLIAAYRAPGARSASEGYDDGTARSQCGQIMNLFSTLKLADRVGQTLTKNPKSILFDRIKSVIDSQVALAS